MSAKTDTRRPMNNRKKVSKKKKERAHAAVPSTSSTADKMPTDEKAPSLNLPEGPSPNYKIRVRFRDGTDFQEILLTTNDQEFYPFAQKWRYVVANRRRITVDTRLGLSEEIFERVREFAKKDAEGLRGLVKLMARSGVVEVEIPYVSETVGWAARVFPWENIIGLLTKPYRAEDSTIAVIRYLADKDRTSTSAETPTSLVVVRSGPGKLAELFDFQRECQAVIETIGLPGAGGHEPFLREPDRDQLRSRVTANPPSVIHLSGVDPLALQSYELAELTDETRDGFVLRGTAEPYDAVGPLEMASILTSGSVKPTLVAISSCFSGDRVAAMAVALGSRYAVGFQDTVTDCDALLFFTAFYRGWSREWDILKAFEEARTQFIRQATSKASGGVVLWTSLSLLQPANETKRFQKSRTKSIKVAEASDIRLHIEHWPNLNYSLLHNNRSPFKNFLVDKQFPGKLPPLRIEVALEVGSEICRCRFSEPLPEDEQPLKLAERIRLPLVAGLLRQCSESLRTNLYTRVECGDHVLCERSDRITVLPADEWRDDGEDHRWLPSFVLPRDPKVLRIVTAAKRYLQTLLDDCSAGFDGYQRLSHDDSNSADVVDPQVQAIWAALQHEMPLTYINPPPSYTSQSQRLRTPGQVFDGNAATCIDLSLLFASCLEFVGIYPSIFLITGHAFPGYWRSDKVWWQMRQFKFKDISSEGSQLVSTPVAPMVTRGQGEGWMFTGVDNLAELLRYVQAGSLVPFESTYVTAKRGFYEALELGSSRLHPESFDAMIDVQSARGEDVTPLPILEYRL